MFSVAKLGFLVLEKLWFDKVSADGKYVRKFVISTERYNLVHDAVRRVDKQHEEDGVWHTLYIEYMVWGAECGLISLDCTEPKSLLSQIPGKCINRGVPTHLVQRKIEKKGDSETETYTVKRFTSMDDHLIMDSLTARC